ncbi:MAG: hypothetical protein JSU57_01195 [Candidatus Heimdallarchaeota archaeon]|nr:MAG: hypothetical protein JSU57_01195 [Candidatus Heimdallarchaeota archaeon]
MLWKHTLGKPGNTYIIGKHWVKKNIPKTNRVAKTLHKESCPGAIYDIGFHYLPDGPSKQQHLWICIETGQLFKKEPLLGKKPTVEPKKVKPKPIVTKPPVKVKKKVEPIIEKPPEPVPEPIVEPTKPTVPTTPTANTLTSVSEVKGIGKAAYEKLSVVNIKTIGDLLSKHSQEIATMIGRKSDKQVKIWQENAQKMLTG